MSTALTSLKEQLKKELKTLDKSVPAPSGNTISTNGKLFKLPNGQTSPGPFQCVILDWRNFNRYYPPGNEYNPQNPKPPACFAINQMLEDLAPHEKAGSPQSDDCASCKHNQWGSDPRGGRGKACENRVKIALVPADADENSEVYVLSVSPTAVKHWANYVNGLRAVDRHPIEVVTTLSFDPNAAYPTVRFNAQAQHDILDVLAGLREKAQPLLDQPPST